MILPLLLAVKSLALALPLVGLARRWRLLSGAAQVPFLFLAAAGVPAASAFLSFALGGGIGLAANVVTIAAALLLFLTTRHECAAFVKEQRTPLALLGVVYVFWLSQEALLPAFSGAWWERDWYRYYFIAEIFHSGTLDLDGVLFGRSLTREFFGRNWLGPLFAAHHMADWPGVNPFRVFQAAFVFLALGAVAAAGALARCLFSARGKRVQILTLGLLPFVPAFAQNACYPWPKMLVVAAVLTYLLVRLEQIRDDVPALRSGLVAGLIGAMAILAHLGAAPYLLGTELAIAFASLRRPLPWLKHAAMLAIFGVLFLAPYYGWLLSLTDPRTIVSGIVITNETSPAAILRQVAINGVNSLFPFRDAFYTKPWPLVPFYAQLRIAYDTIAGLLHPLGWLLLAAGIARERKRSGWPFRAGGEGRVLVGASVFGGLLCMVLHDGADAKGLMTVALLPPAALILIAVFRALAALPRTWRILLGGWIVLYGATVRIVHLAGLHQGFLLDGNYTAIQVPLGLRLWNDDLGALGESLFTALALCSGALLLVLMGSAWRRAGGVSPVDDQSAPSGESGINS